jgi:hypothetical protein
MEGILFEIIVDTWWIVLELKELPSRLSLLGDIDPTQIL